MTRLPDQQERKIPDRQPIKNHISQKRKTTSPQASTGASRPKIMSKRFKFFGMSAPKPKSSASDIPLIVQFYDPDIQAQDARGRTLEQILSWPNSELERCHNYIQMLFPVPEGSAFNWEAPLIDRQVMDAFRARKELRDSLKKSFERMLEFYGFTFAGETAETGGDDVGSGEDTTGRAAALDTYTASQDDYRITRGPNWHEASRNWAVRFDHNHLRITRILRCLRVLGLQPECEAFFSALRSVFDDPTYQISQRSMDYWGRAVTRPLSIAPDDDRIDWLSIWEAEQSVVDGAEGESQDVSVRHEKSKEGN